MFFFCHLPFTPGPPIVNTYSKHLYICGRNWARRPTNDGQCEIIPEVILKIAFDIFDAFITLFFLSFNMFQLLVFFRAMLLPSPRSVAGSNGSQRPCCCHPEWALTQRARAARATEGSRSLGSLVPRQHMELGWTRKFMEICINHYKSRKSFSLFYL
jgi:hypothetical protein